MLSQLKLAASLFHSLHGSSLHPNAHIYQNLELLFVTYLNSSWNMRDISSSMSSFTALGWQRCHDQIHLLVLLLQPTPKIHNSDCSKEIIFLYYHYHSPPQSSSQIHVYIRCKGVFFCSRGKMIFSSTTMANSRVRFGHSKTGTK